MIAIRSQDMIEVTQESDGSIAIVQRSDRQDVDDAVVMLWPEHVEALTAALQAARDAIAAGEQGK